MLKETDIFIWAAQPTTTKNTQKKFKLWKLGCDDKKIKTKVRPAEWHSS